MDAIEDAVAIPKYKIIMYRALRREVLGQCAPLTTRAQDVHDPVHHLPDINRSFVAAGLGGRDHRRDMRPFLVRQITRISQPAAFETFAVLRRLHIRDSPPNQATTLNHNRFKRFNIFSERHSDASSLAAYRLTAPVNIPLFDLREW